MVVVSGITERASSYPWNHIPRDTLEIQITHSTTYYILPVHSIYVVSIIVNQTFYRENCGRIWKQRGKKDVRCVCVCVCVSRHCHRWVAYKGRTKGRTVTRLQHDTTLVIGHRFPFGFRQWTGLDLIQFNPG